MNGNVKWHKATGPAFNPGEVWVGSGGGKVEIVSVRRYRGAPAVDDGDHTSNYGVSYKWVDSDGVERFHEKDAWNFQVRYTHIADLNLKPRR